MTTPSVVEAQRHAKVSGEVQWKNGPPQRDPLSQKTGSSAVVVVVACGGVPVAAVER